MAAPTDDEIPEPYGSGLLDVGDGNHIYWETCGLAGTRRLALFAPTVPECSEW